jgi:hypothetical protein
VLSVTENNCSRYFYEYQEFVMKKAFAIVLLILSGPFAKADIVKPHNTTEIANGKITIGEVNYDYSVRDRGWSSSGTFNGSIVDLEEEKTFILQYESSDFVFSAKSAIQWLAVRADAGQKCLELGRIEFQGQTKSYDSSFKKNLTAKIDKTSNPDPAGNMTAFCRVVIMVTNK